MQEGDDRAEDDDADGVEQALPNRQVQNG